MGKKTLRVKWLDRDHKIPYSTSTRRPNFKSQQCEIHSSASQMSRKDLYFDNRPSLNHTEADLFIVLSAGLFWCSIILPTWSSYRSSVRDNTKTCFMTDTSQMPWQNPNKHPHFTLKNLPTQWEGMWARKDVKYDERLV